MKRLRAGSGSRLLPRGNPPTLLVPQVEGHTRPSGGPFVYLLLWERARERGSLPDGSAGPQSTSEYERQLSALAARRVQLGRGRALRRGRQPPTPVGAGVCENPHLATWLPGGALPGPLAIGQLSRLGAVTCQQGLPREIRLIINRIAIRNILTLILILIITSLECT